MDNIKTETFCRLCVNVIDDEDYREIDDATREILHFVSSSVDLDDKLTHLICSSCSEKLYAAFHYKSSCNYINNVVSTYANCTDVRIVDLKEVYLTEKEKTLSVTLSEDQKVCRLCLELTDEGFKPINAMDENTISTFISEIDFNVVKDAVICGSCLNSLKIHSSFIKQCLYSINQIDTKNPTNSAWTHTYIKTEEMEIKSEEKAMQPNSIKKQYQKCSKYDFKTVQEYEMKEQELNHKNSPERDIFKKSKDGVYKCDTCDYQAKYKCNLKVHMLMHKDPAEIQWYKCDECDYKAKNKRSLRSHLIQHKDSSEIQWYNCDMCDHKAKTKCNLKRHMLRHKTFSEIQWYKCDTCDFVTKYKTNFNFHNLGHKNSSEVQWYECNECDYKAKVKRLLKLHMLQHKNPSEIKWYQCNECDYKAKVKQKLKKHMLDHKDPSEVQWYQCETCDYKTKTKYLLTAHQLVHKNPLEISWYNCDVCDHKSKTRSALNKHMLQHKDPSEIQWYKCDVCDYMSKYKTHLKKHILKHDKSGDRNVDNPQA